MIPTPHIEIADPSLLADTVLMPGDPLRAKFIADTYLEDATLVNSIRNMLGFTGSYNGKRVSVFGSGMGMPSVGIYSYELFQFYGVKNIIRVGSAGSYVESLKLRDIVIASDAWSESTYVQTQDPRFTDSVVPPSRELNQRLEDSAKRLHIPIVYGRVHSTDVFYRSRPEDFVDIYREHQCVAVDMDSVALFHNARISNAHAACILTISDCLVTHEASSSEERRSSFHNMIQVALGIL